MNPLRRLSIATAVTLTLVACGGGGNEPMTAQQAAQPSKSALKVVAPTLPNPLPTTAPAPDILVRESFGLGPDIARPAGGRGDMRPTYLHTGIGGFWVEWPGSKNTAWIAPDAGQTWRFCGTNATPYELPSPLQAAPGTEGCAASEWFDMTVATQWPTALLPFTPPATAWQVSMEGYPSVIEGAYVALGLTSSGATYSNFSSVGQVWLSLRKQQVMVNGPLVYELRVNGMAGPLLATGVVDDLTWNTMVIGYDPVAQVLSASINGIALGPFPMALTTPKYAGFEGIGIMDNFVVRKLN
jgi:hypothetical protein